GVSAFWIGTNPRARDGPGAVPGRPTQNRLPEGSRFFASGSLACSAYGIGGFRVGQSEQGTQEQSRVVPPKGDNDPNPAVKAEGGDASEVGADVASEGQAGAVAHQEASDHRRRGRAPGDPAERI